MPNRLIKRIKNVKNEGQNADTEKEKPARLLTKVAISLTFVQK